MVIFLTCSRYRQKNISNKVFTFLLSVHARGAVAELDENSAKDCSLAMEWAEALQSVWPWRLL